MVFCLRVPLFGHFIQRETKRRPVAPFWGGPLKKDTPLQIVVEAFAFFARVRFGREMISCGLAPVHRTSLLTVACSKWGVASEPNVGEGMTFISLNLLRPRTFPFVRSSLF